MEETPLLPTSLGGAACVVVVVGQHKAELSKCLPAPLQGTPVPLLSCSIPNHCMPGLLC